MADQIDPQLMGLLEELGSAGVPPWHQLSVKSARRIEQEVFDELPGPSMGRIHEVGIPGPAGNVALRIFTPSEVTEDPLPILVYLRGGGWVVGTLDSDDGVCRGIADQANCIVVSVDYSRAPEYAFPVAVHETLQAVKWCKRNASAFGGNPDRIGIAGSSAGGNLAASATLLAREQGGPCLQCQILVYPMLDYNLERDSYQEHAGGPLIGREDVKWFWDQYLPDPVDAYNPLASPLRMSDLSGLPPTTIVTAGFDPLRDEGIAYAEQLENSNVAVKHRHYPSLTHIFLNLAPAVDTAEGALNEISEDVKIYL